MGDDWVGRWLETGDTGRSAAASKAEVITTLPRKSRRDTTRSTATADVSHEGDRQPAGRDMSSPKANDGMDAGKEGLKPASISDRFLASQLL